MLPKYRKFIINDFKLPKIVVDSPYFETQYELLKYYGFAESFEFVERCIDDFGSIELFFEEVKLLSNTMFNYVAELYKGYQVNVPDKAFYDNAKSEFNKTLINPEAANRSYIRVDIKQACFNVLKEMTSKLDDYVSYVEFVHRFNEFDESVRDYVAASKRIRSYIFGCIQKNIIIHLEKNIIGSIIKNVDGDVVFKDCDEVVYELNDHNSLMVNEAVNASKFRKILRVEEFVLKPIDYGYVECHNDHIVFKGIPAHYFSEQYALYYLKPFHEHYKVFNFEDRPCMRI